MTDSGDRKKRAVGLIGAIAIGIGGMVGGGIFAVLGEAVALAHKATPVAFLFSGIIALVTSYAYAKLSVRFPSRGGTVLFVDQAFGSNLASGSVNLMLWLSYLVTIALYAVAFASYAETFFPGLHSSLFRHAMISLVIVLPTLINLVSASFVSKSETAIVALKLLLLLLILGFSAPALASKPVTLPAPGAVPSIFMAGMVIFVAYEGFELIANASGEIVNPARNLPRAFYASVLVVIALYMLIGYVTVQAVPEAQLMRAKDYALAVAARPALGQTGFVIVSVAALLATFSAINATIYGNARLGYFLARDGELPEIFDRQAWNEPVMGVVMTAAISLIIANAITLTEIAVIASASFLCIFALINASALRLRRETGGRGVVFAAGVLLCSAALLALLLHASAVSGKAIPVFLGFIAFSVLFELTYGAVVRGHFLGRQYGRHRHKA
ncbi:MAG TPA: amino acid permease [Chlorobaculum parvum]|uniref:Amino acid permease n=1 Tax=Chlorobaculum parvum TaxID=274539 RepID=A0A7C5DJG2_9CHLB|nr:amino acid permease [Chlorobaculum parvum]